MAKLDSGNKYFKSYTPQYTNGSTFLGFKQPGAQFMTSFSPSSDINAYLQATSGLSGYKFRELMQSKIGSQMVGQGMAGTSNVSSASLRVPAFHSKAACQTDADCGDGQTCYAFNEQVFGPQQGPTCSPTVYPEIMLGNAVNNGTPLRQESNYCYSDADCQGVDKYTGKRKVGMTCNHFYKGPDVFEKNGMCQVQYEDKGKRFFLKTPPGWVWPLNKRLRECKTQSDCGVTGINGWTRCVGGSDDGKKYCTWPGQTYTPNPRELAGQTPRGMQAQPIPSSPTPSGLQAQVLNLESEMASQPGFSSPGGPLRNVSGIPPPSNTLVSNGGGGVPQAMNVGGFK